MSLLTICQNVANEIGLDEPTSIVNNNDDTAKRLLAITNAEGRRLLKLFDWQALTKEGSFTTVAQEEQGAISTILSNNDFDRFLRATMYNQAQGEKVHGSVPAQKYAYDKANGTGSLSDTFRVRGSKVLMNSAPTAGQLVTFEYISSHWVENSAGTETKSSMTEDGDVPLLDETLIELGVRWRMRQSMGFDYGDEQAEYRAALYNQKANDRPARVLFLDGGDEDAVGVRVADGGWHQ